MSSHDEGGGVSFVVHIGGVELPGSLTLDQQEILDDALGRFNGEMLVREIQRYVTQQIAHEVLSVYGDERATPPSLATQSLITLIRTCLISDDAMLANLNEVEDFHGYVLAIGMLTEDGRNRGGMAVLRCIAELFNDDDRAEMKKMGDEE